METVSNKALAILLVGAIFVSLMGTFVSLNRLEQFQPTGLRGITGMYSDTGQVQLEVSELVSFTLNSNVDFGQITPNASQLWISTETNNSQWAGVANDCTDLTGSCFGLEIENDGNGLINLSFNTTSNASTFIGGTDQTPVFSFMMVNGNRSGFGNENGCNGTLGYNLSYTSITEDTDYLLCNNTITNSSSGFNWEPGEDKMTMEFNLTIPTDAPQSGTKTATLTFFNP